MFSYKKLQNALHQKTQAYFEYPDELNMCKTFCF